MLGDSPEENSRLTDLPQQKPIGQVCSDDGTVILGLVVW